MSTSRDPARRHGFGPGAPMAFLIIGGVVLGGLLGQPVIGFFVGTGLGLLVALIGWWMGRRS